MTSTSTPIDWAFKRGRVHSGDVAELNAMVDRWMTVDRLGPVPWFDPDDGGRRARMLVLLETPGPKTVGEGGSMMCSFDNKDSTNPVLRQMLSEVGVDRRMCVKWNAVPWACLDDGGRATSPRAADLDAAAPFLAETLSLLPALELVVTLGAKSLDGYMRCLTAQTPQRILPVIAAPHPSARNARARAAALARVRIALTAASAHLGSR
ncbi:uracil-DNA glycosylase [Gordonia sp. CPCC 205515]|uniref:uracil-DNA glycosylase n=1 Tax=Gordonia sp. CPCC 205515 TaxID=3140791 RepID=UPI003AF3D3F9